MCNAFLELVRDKCPIQLLFRMGEAIIPRDANGRVQAKCINTE
jgi:hypothetical protein